MFFVIIFSNLNSHCSYLLDLRNLQEQVKKAFCYQKLFWPFTVWTNCSSNLKNFANSASNFKSFSWSLEQFFLTVGQNNFGNKITFLIWKSIHVSIHPEIKILCMVNLNLEKYDERWLDKNKFLTVFPSWCIIWSPVKSLKLNHN